MSSRLCRVQLRFVVRTFRCPTCPSFWPRQSERNPLPHSFLVRSLEEFVGYLPDNRVLCLVRAVRVYLRVTEALCPRPRAVLYLYPQVALLGPCQKICCPFSSGG